MYVRIAGNPARFVLSLLAGHHRRLRADARASRGPGGDRRRATRDPRGRWRAWPGSSAPTGRFPVQYWDWFSGLWRGDFGVSYVTRTDISPLVADKVQVSLILVTLAMAAGPGDRNPGRDPGRGAAPQASRRRCSRH